MNMRFKNCFESRGTWDVAHMVKAANTFLIFSPQGGAEGFRQGSEVGFSHCGAGLGLGM